MRFVGARSRPGGRISAVAVTTRVIAVAAPSGGRKPFLSNGLWPEDSVVGAGWGESAASPWRGRFGGAARCRVMFGTMLALTKNAAQASRLHSLGTRM